MSATIEGWCAEFIAEGCPDAKLAPPPRPATWGGAPVVPHAPGRGPRFEVATRAERMPTGGALVREEARGRLLLTFLHHEVQAAELMAWAVLRFPETPRRFRTGLLAILDDELRHSRLYAERARALGLRYGERPVRDWFWQRVPSCKGPVSFVALMGMGFEGGNLEHTRRFGEELRQAGDPESARLVDRVGEEEVRHVRFATRWFARWTQDDPGAEPEFRRWIEALPPPLTPTVLRGRPLDRLRRERAGQRGTFLDRLEAWDDSPSS